MNAQEFIDTPTSKFTAVQLRVGSNWSKKAMCRFISENLVMES